MANNLMENNQGYELAFHHVELALKDNPKNKEAKIISSYVVYEDNMLAAAFWEKD